ncbi:MAG: GAF domain-containing sensor histidine kinase, partial [Phycisphaerae bacterium]
SEHRVEWDLEDKPIDSSILASASASEESVILASPEAYDAVHAWNVMYQLAETIGTFVSVVDFLERVTDIISKHLQVDRIFILMREEHSDELQPYVIRQRDRDNAKRGKITTSRRIINHVLSTREGVLCANAQSETRFGADQKDASIHHLGLRSVICVPILTREDVAGVIHLDCSMANHTYTQQQLLLTTAIGKMVGMAIENERLIQSRVEHERLAAVGETVAHLSHNIRNILQGMRSGADVIGTALKRGSLENVRAGWEIVQRNLERTYRLASNMLTFSKDRQPHIELAQLNKLIEEVLQLTRQSASDKGATVETELDDLPPVPLDVDGIHQVITNIITNALDACPKGSGRIVVRTFLDDSAHQVMMSITDNGPGIPDSERKRIFDPFYSNKGHGGTGLGLAVAKQIVDELAGVIEVDSSADGTTFTVRLSTAHAELADSDETHGPAT